MKTAVKNPVAVLATAIVAGLLVFVPPREGRRNEAYPDPAHGWAVPTICYGHTRGVKKGDTATDAQCLAYLEDDIRRIALPAVMRHVRVSISVDQGVALGDFAFNVGERAFARSTLVRRLNACDCLGAAREFGYWVYASGKRFPGLVKRRKDEAALFIHDCPQQTVLSATSARGFWPSPFAANTAHRNLE